MSRLLALFIFSIFILIISADQEVPKKRIINGRQASRIEWALTRPWLAKNVCDYGKGEGWETCGCSSTIINRHFLLTAGHCLRGTYNYKIGLQLSNGVVIPSDASTGYAEIHTPWWEYGSIISKEYCGVRSVIQGDVALQYFAKPIQYSWGVQEFPGFFRKVAPIRPGSKATVSGWGAITEEGGANFYYPTLPNNLQKLEETVFPNEECQAVLNAWFGLIHEVLGVNCSFAFTDQLVCAGHKPLSEISFSYDETNFGYPNDPAGICTGDSGSPLFDFASYRIYGTVSDTLSTSATGPCGYGVDIYTRLTQQIVDWVKGEVLAKGLKVDE